MFESDSKTTLGNPGQSSCPSEGSLNSSPISNDVASFKFRLSDLIKEAGEGGCTLDGRPASAFSLVDLSNDAPKSDRPHIDCRTMPMKDWDGPLISMDDLSYRPAPKSPT